MAVSEERRHELYLGLESLLGRERATTMMEMLPPVGWADVATRRDLAHHELVLRAELETLGSSLRAEMASMRSELHGEIASLRSEVQGEIASLRSEVQGEIASLRSDVRSLEVEVGRVGDRVLGVLEARINDALVSQTRWVVGSVLATFIAFAGLVLGIGR